MNFEDSELYLLHSVVVVADNIAQKHLLPTFGLSYPQFLLLNVVFHNPGLSQNGLAELLGLGKSAVSQRVSELAKKSLIDQKSNPENRRENFLFLTETGKALTQNCQKTLLQAADEVFSSALPDREKFKEELKALLSRFLDRYQRE